MRSLDAIEPLIVPPNSRQPAALLVNAQDLVEIGAGTGVKAEPSPAGGTAKRGSGGQIDTAKEGVGRLDSRDSREP